MWKDKGDLSFDLESYDDALNSYEKALQLSPSYADAWYGKANALGQLKRYEEALS